MGRRKKKKTPPKKTGGGSMRNMRSGFQGMFKGDKRGSGAGEVQFYKIAGVLFLIGALIFFATR